MLKSFVQLHGSAAELPRFLSQTPFLAFMAFTTARMGCVNRYMGVLRLPLRKLT